jgi:hypothetical protein
VTRHTFSPDVLEANPELAAKVKRSKARTPGGQGHGHTPDAQAYGAAGKFVDAPLVIMRANLRNMICLLRGSLATRCIAAQPGLVDAFDEAAAVIERLLERIAEQPK